MKTETKILLTLLILTPFIAELQSGSSKPSEFFNPISLLFLIFTYGGVTVLIREYRSYLKSNLSLLFLAPLMGIIQEGFLMQSFFNSGFKDVSSLANYGLFWGVQWIWTIKLIILHSVISVIVPILIVDFTWPEYKYKKILSLKTKTILIVGILVFSFLIYKMILVQISQQVIYYSLNFLHFIGLVVVSLLLIYFAFRVKDTNLKSKTFTLLPPIIFLIFGFVFRMLNYFMQDAFAKMNINIFIALFVQLIWIIILSFFFYFQIMHESCSIKHIVYLIIGILLFSIVSVSFYSYILNIEFPIYFLIELVSLIMLFIWKKRILHVTD